MKGSYRIARVAGIEVRLHFTFLLLLAFYGWNYYQAGGWDAALVGVTFILTLFLCVLLHEFGHAFAARSCGIRTPDITLLPFGGVARLARMPSSPKQELWIALAGPAVNVAILLSICVIWGKLPNLSDLARMESPGGFLADLFLVNVMLVLFNLIPAFPMDGGRVLRALLAMKLRHVTATLIAARVGQVIAVLFGGAALIPAHHTIFSLFGYELLGTGNPMLLLIAVFVFAGAQQELSYARLRVQSLDLRVGQAMVTQFQSLPSEVKVGEISSLLSTNDQGVFPLVDDSLQLRGLATRDELLQAARELPAQSEARSVARQLPVLHPETALEEARDLMQRLAEPVLAVVDASGQIVGLASQLHLTELCRLRRTA